MAYSHTAAITSNGLPKSLKWANIQNSTEQMVLVEKDQYSLAVIAPENYDLFQQRATLGFVQIPEFQGQRKAFISSCR